MDVYENRNVYRNQINADDLTFFRVQFKETDLLIGAPMDISHLVEKSVMNARRILDEHIENNQIFYDSLKPIRYNETDEVIIKHMCMAAKAAGVGPMAAVAGAFCQTVYDAIKDEEMSELIVENGGDLLVRTKRGRIIALYAGDSPLSMKLGLKIKGSDRPVGICTSAGTFGHSKSFGKSDLALCISEDVLLADACATQLGNMVKTDQDLKSAVEKIYRIPGIKGAVAIIGSQIAAIGLVELIPMMAEEK